MQRLPPQDGTSVKALLESLLKEGYEITFYRTGLKARKTYVILRKNGDAKAECASEHIEDALADAAMKSERSRR